MMMRVLITLLFVLANVSSVLFAQTPESESESPFPEVDKEAKHTPFWVNYNTQRLSHHLTKPYSTEEEKVRAIYYWITCHVRYDAKRFRRNVFKEQTPRKTLFRRKALCTHYSQLFAELCKHAGIDCYEVPGYVKGVGYKTDDIFHNSDHSWSMVRINGHWYLFDITFASGYLKLKPTFGERTLAILGFRSLTKSKLVFRKRLDDFYYKTRPALFVKDHLPVARELQLLEEPISLEEFENDTLSWNMKGTQNDSSASEIMLQLKADDPLAYIALADSAYIFNCRNVLCQAGFYDFAAGRLLIQAIFKEKKQGGSDLGQVQDAFKYADSAVHLLPRAKEMIMEEAYYKTQKNLQRKTLCMQYLVKAARVNNKAISATNIKESCKHKIKFLKRQNRYIDKAERAFMRKDISRIIPMRRIKREKAEILIRENNRQINIHKDTVKAELLFLNTCYATIKDTLFNGLLSTQARIAVLQDAITDFSFSSTAMRFEHIDNKDEELKYNNSQRYFYGDSLAQVLIKRKQLKDSLRFNEKQIRTTLRKVNKLTLKNITLMKKNKRLDYYNRGQFDSTIQSMITALDSVGAKNEKLIVFTMQEQKWAEGVFGNVYAVSVLIYKERFLEQHRYQVRSFYIKGQRRRWMKVCSSISANSNTIRRIASKKLKA